MKADFHLHSCFSGDSQTPPEEHIKTGLERGISILCFTDHLDADYPYADVDFELDTKAYVSRILRLQADYIDKIDLRLGVELGLAPHLGDNYHSYVNQYPFDFVIGSTHIVDQIDPYYPEFWASRDSHSGIRRYLEVTLENIKAFDDFDVYGHLDYVIRYAPVEKRAFSYGEFKDEIDAILKLLIEKGKGIEINTGGYKAGLGVPNPCPEVIRRYKELGGEIITMGSDAHTSEYLGFCFDKAQEILRSCGFSYFTVFRGRKPEFIPL